MRGPLRQLGKGVAIYGAGDAAIQVVNFALLAVYVKGGFLTDVDYGALAILVALEAFTKVVSRLGLDGAFMRYYADRTDGLPRLASTILWFLLCTNLGLFGLALLAAPWLGEWLFDDPAYTTALKVMLVNSFLMAFTFVPFHMMRMRNQAVAYSALTFARSVGTLVLRIAFVIAMGMGLTGMYMADLVVTLVLLPVMWPYFRQVIRLVFSWDDLRLTLRFGLPRVPHGLAQQALDGGNKLLLSAYVTQGQLGVYQNGVTLGTAIKFFTNAFETAWAPFYYTTSRQPDAKAVLARMTTYGFAVLVLLVAGTVAVARDAVLVVLTADYLAAVPVLPIVAVGMACQGAYLLTSIGLNLTSRTEFYPVATFAAAFMGLSAGAVLMPLYGALGAALAYFIAYAVQAVVAFFLAHHVYPIAYEYGRIGRVMLAGTAASLIAGWGLPAMPPLPGLFIRGFTVIVVYAAALWVAGFFRTNERAFVIEFGRRLVRRA